MVRKYLYKKADVLKLLREALGAQMCQCDVCNAPATRELQNEDKSLFCDDHGDHGDHGDEGEYKDLRAPFCIVNADWVRKVVAILKEYDKI